MKQQRRPRILVLVVVTTVGLAAFGACEPAARRTESSFQQNVEYTSWRAISYLVGHGTYPTFVTLQELCEDSFNSAKAKLE